MTREFLEERAFDLGEITSFLNPGALFRHWQARRSVKHLASLDDYLLRDIGLKRSDVGARARGAGSSAAAIRRFLSTCSCPGS
jgi:uncharacterized protein YjiS (DUF1127 family)